MRATYKHVMHLHCEMDPPNLHSTARNNQAKSPSAMQLSVVPIKVSHDAHAAVMCRTARAHACKCVCYLCAWETFLCKRFFVTAQCSGSAYVMGEGC